MTDLLKLQVFDLESKILNRVYYPRAYKRGYILKNQDHACLDTGDSFILNNNKLCTSVRGKISGSAIDLSYQLFENKNNLKLKFLQHIASSNISSAGLLPIYKKQLEMLYAIKNEQYEIKPKLILLRAVKGGYKVFSSGVTGFLPRSNFRWLLSPILARIRGAEQNYSEVIPTYLSTFYHMFKLDKRAPYNALHKSLERYLPIHALKISMSLSTKRYKKVNFRRVYSKRKMLLSALFLVSPIPLFTPRLPDLKDLPKVLECDAQVHIKLG